MTRSRALALVAITLLAAAALRLPDLTETPPGPHHDEAANGLLAAGLDSQGAHPLVVTASPPKESLYFYLAGGLMELLGENLFALRLTTAFLGVLTVAATYWAGRELLADRRVALIASALLAISFWHLLVSRLGFRAATLPLLQALAAAVLFRGLQRNTDLWFGVGGVLLGLTVYTYPPAWFFLLVLALALIPLLADPQRRRLRATQLALCVGVLLLVVAPLLLYFYRNPGTVQLGFPFPIEVIPPFFERFLRALGLFFLVGDPSWRFNLPGQPIFNWFWGGLLVAGWFIALRRWRRWWYDWQKSAVLLLLLVPLLMALPVALSPPANLRAVGFIPFIFYLPALGLVTLVEQLADRFRGMDEEGAAFLRALSLLERYDVNYTFLVLFILLLGSVFTARRYFESWAPATELFYSSDADLAAMAPVLDSAAADTLYVAAEHAHHPTVHFLSERSEEVKWLKDGRALVLPPSGDALYFYPLSNPRPLWAAPYLEDDPRLVGPAGPDGRPTFAAYALRGTPAPLPGGPSQEHFANFGNVIRLTGFRAEAGVAGETISLRLAWEVTASPAPTLRPFVHLYDSWNNHWSAIELDGYPAAQWSAGETIIEQVELPLPPGTPPGTYRLQVGFSDPGNGRLLSHLDEEGRYAGKTLDLSEVTVAAGEPPARLPAAPSGTPQVVRDGLSLLGYDRSADPVHAGSSLPLALWWHASASQPSLTMRLTLTRADNTGIILLDTRPVHGTYPFPQWPAPQFVVDQVNPQIPSGLEAGNYRLELSLITEEGKRVFSTGLGSVTVISGDRRFTIPPLSYPLSAGFADEIMLVGYDLQRAAEGQYTLTLAWRALQSPAADYVVRVRLLAADGTCCLWLAERPPQRPASSGDQPAPYPTGSWLPGEVVLDAYSVRLPPDLESGPYPLSVSLHWPETGRPLRVQVPELPASGAASLRPLLVDS